MIKELTVKSSQALQHTTPEHYATTRLPINRSLTVACPPCIRIRNKHIRNISQGPQVQRGNPISPRRRKRSSWPLERAIRVDYTATKTSCFRMTVGKRNPLL